MTDPYEGRREAMVQRLEGQGIVHSPRVVEAMRRVPRHLFVPRSLRESAYYDTPLSIGAGQTISAPHMVGMMLEALDLREGQRVLEVGGGSGYHAALVGEVVAPTGRVYALERIASLARRARKNLEATGLGEHVEVVVGDGSLGLEAHAPYDRVFVTCGAPGIPPPLAAQTAEGGKLLIPVGSRYYQDLILAEKRGGKVRQKSLGGCVFVPLRGEHGF